MAHQRALPPQHRFPVRQARRWVLSSVIGSLVITMLVFILNHFGLSVLFFLLLPMIVTLITMYRRLYDNLRLLILVGAIAFVYNSAITGFELLTHNPQVQEYIVVTTTLTLAIMFEPVRSYALNALEHRLRLSDTPAHKAVEAYTATLREEIDLEKVRDGLLTTLEQAMQPYTLALWLAAPRAAAADEAHLGDHAATHLPAVPADPAQPDAPQYIAATALIAIADDDGLLTYTLRHSGALEMRRLRTASSESPFAQTLRKQDVEIVAPLVSQGQLLGLVGLGLRLDGEAYSREDRSLLTTLAAQVAPALRVAQLAQAQQQQAREHERIEQELRTAQVIQRTFLPKDIPTLAGWQLATCYQPAREVGGDFYDFISLPDGQLGLVIGDVTGKGIPAALMMTATRTMLRAVAPACATPGDVLARVNELLRADIPAGMFVTCFYAMLNPVSGRLRFANAGQDQPLLRHGIGAVEELRATVMPLGLLPSTQYEEGVVALTVGDSLLFYSDGLVEAHNPQREMFDLPRLRQLVGEQPGGAPLIAALLAALATFTGPTWEQEDDVTLVTLQRLDAAAGAENVASAQDASHAAHKMVE